MISAVPQLDIPEQLQFLGGGPAVLVKNTFIDCKTTFLDSEDSALQPSGLSRSKTAPAHPAGIVSSMSPRPGWEHDESASPECRLPSPVNSTRCPSVDPESSHGSPLLSAQGWEHDKSASPEWPLPGSPVISTRCSSSVDPESSYGSPWLSAHDLEPIEPQFRCRAGTEELREEIEGLQALSAYLHFGSNTTAEPAVPGFRCQENLHMPFVCLQADGTGALFYVDETFKSDGSALSERLSPGFSPATPPGVFAVPPQVPPQPAMEVMGSAWPGMQRVGSFAQEAPRRPRLSVGFDSTTGELRVTWLVDAKKLNGNEKQAVSPSFNLQAALPQDSKGKVPPGSFKMIARAIERTFKKNNGRAILELKCEENLSGETPDLTFSFAIGHGNKKSAPGAQIIHNFAEHPIPEACKKVEWELLKAVDSVSQTVDVELTVFLSAA